MRKLNIGDWVEKKFAGRNRIGKIEAIVDDKQFPNSDHWYRCKVLWIWENGLRMTSPKFTQSQGYTLKPVQEPK